MGVVIGVAKPLIFIRAPQRAGDIIERFRAICEQVGIGSVTRRVDRSLQDLLIEIVELFEKGLVH
jgi:hypothetical protein